jgi:hypothetical protein
MGWRYLDLADYLLIAEAILEIPAAQLARLERLGLAESALNAPAAGFGEVEAYVDFTSKAARRCKRRRGGSLLSQAAGRSEGTGPCRCANGRTRAGPSPSHMGASPHERVRAARGMERASATYESREQFALLPG